MTVEYDRSDEIMEMTCDSCGETGEFEGTFPECIKQFKEDGWKIEHCGESGGSDDYEHTCPDCLNKPLEEKI